MARVLLIAGTSGYTEEWWRPGSAFATMLKAAGHELAAPDDAYSWTTHLDGVLGDNREWVEAGKALAWWLIPHPVDAIIAHSHGGNVAAHGLARLPASRSPRTFITVGTPVRAEMRAVYRAARDRLERWRHIRSGRTDAWQRWGSLSWWDWLRPWRWQWERDMEYADGNVYVPGVSHEGLLAPELWIARHWADWITPPRMLLPPPTAETPAAALAPPAVTPVSGVSV